MLNLNNTTLSLSLSLFEMLYLSIANLIQIVAAESDVALFQNEEWLSYGC